MTVSHTQLTRPHSNGEQTVCRRLDGIVSVDTKNSLTTMMFCAEYQITYTPPVSSGADAGWGYHEMLLALQYHQHKFLIHYILAGPSPLDGPVTIEN